ncbi:MAG: adenosylmethionine--8-amino-7-oxononanoate transaminase [Planctomycetota bacterium]|nr:MAG: adenosylmethionine--8-amino-7-oxononanoate transaminase [Planctomycetota bacterium]
MDLNPASDWLPHDRQHCWHPYTQHGLDPEPLPVVAAEGSWLQLADGRRLLDAISSWWTVLHGHGQPELISAMTEQAKTLDHVLFAGCTHEPAARLAAELTNLAPGELSRAFFSDDGSTAVEVALKAAYQFHLREGRDRRTTFLALNGGYHGDTFGAMAAGDPDPFFQEFSPLLFRVLRIDPTLEALHEALKAHSDQIAAFLFEPMVQGAAGMVMIPPEFYSEAEKLCRERGILTIADEVMTGFGRTGTLFACDQANLNPDLMCLAKGLTGGIFPLSVTLVKEEVFQAFWSRERSRAFFHGHSFTAHPVGCAVARASLALNLRNQTPKVLTAIGKKIHHSLRAWVESEEAVTLRHLGGIVALEFQASDPGYLSGLGQHLRQYCRNSSALLRPLGPVLYAMPPAATSLSEAEQIAKAMMEVGDGALAKI